MPHGDLTADELAGLSVEERAALEEVESDIEAMRKIVQLEPLDDAGERADAGKPDNAGDGLEGGRPDRSRARVLPYFFFARSRACVSADAATDLSALVEFGFLRTRDALLATIALVRSFLAMVISLAISEAEAVNRT